MKKSVKSRIKITRSGKIKRRAMALGHSRANKRSIQMLRKKSFRNLNISFKKIKQLASSHKY